MPINKKQANKAKETPSLLLSVMPELVALDCSLTHVLKAPNTQRYHI